MTINAELSTKSKVFISFYIGAAACLFVAAILLLGNLARNDDRPAWIFADGRKLNIVAYPELFKAMGRLAISADGKTFNAPDIEKFDYLENDRFGTTVLMRCISTRNLRDGTPVATFAWCEIKSR